MISVIYMLPFLSLLVVMQFIKKFIIILLGFFLLISFFFWFLTKTISPKLIQTYVCAKITALTKQPCEIKGNISWQILPRPSVKIEKIQIGSENQASPYQISLGQLFFNLKLSALFQGKLVFNDIKLANFTANLNTNHLKAPLDKRTGAPSNGVQTNPLDEKFVIEQLLITNGKIKINLPNQSLTLHSLQLGAEQINLEQNLFPFQFKAAIDFGINQQPSNAQLQFKGNASFAPNSINQLENLLKSTLVSGQLLIQNLQIGQLKITKLSAHTLFKQASILLNPLTLNLYQGEAIGDLSYNFLAKTLKINQTATGINSAKLTNALFNQVLLKGKLDLSLHSQTNFNNDDWLATTIGNGNINLNQGSLQKVNLDKVIKQISAKISQAQEDKALALALSQEMFDYKDVVDNITPIKLISMQYHLAHKLLFGDTVVLQTNMLQLKGDSQLNLADYSLSSHLTATLSIANNKLNEIQELLGGNFPLIVQGDLNHPVVLPDFKKINSSLAKLWIKDNLTKPILKIKEQLVAFFNN
ncbi:AsmA family protein [Legionella sp. D16C41]|uniref:AsmA family protein n=1 Tax=Legionella sp. D16C41 TaxID=3402688 RepID=UPI003AF938E0